MKLIRVNLRSVIHVSVSALRTNKVRSALTSLGIIIGVAAVISLVALTQGADFMIKEQLTSLGGKALYVHPGKWGVGTPKDVIRLTNKDVVAINQVAEVNYAIPILDLPGEAVYGNKSWFTALVGSSPNFIYINDWYPSNGVFFNQQDVLNIENVCVLGKTVVSKLFGARDPIGKSIRIGKSSFKVIGIMSTLGQTTSGRDQDDLVVFPFTTFQKRIIGEDRVDKIFVSVNTTEDLQNAESQIRTLLRKRHNLRDDKEDTFYIKSQFGIVKKILTISKIMGVLLGSIASISLIVGGVGIMNIMLASVGERTREIGIRMAVGAKERDIRLQFLAEALVLSLAGGAVGVLLGVIVSTLASSFSGWPSIISVQAVLLAFGFAAAVGIFFGLYPAWKASKLDPIEALRYE